MNIIGIIPARYASSRFPGKPLVDIKGKSMIQRVFENASKSQFLKAVYVATDDQRIFDHVLSFGGKVVMTSTEHPSGTDRCNEALEKVKSRGGAVDFVINIQGDEPFLESKQIDLLASKLSSDTQIATLKKRINDSQYLFDENTVKVVSDNTDKAIYFSRHAIPFQRGINKDEWLNTNSYYKHLGIYAYSADVLEKLTALKPSFLEISESLEQLRWLEASFAISVFETKWESFGIDTPEDLNKI